MWLDEAHGMMGREMENRTRGSAYVAPLQIDKARARGMTQTSNQSTYSAAGSQGTDSSRANGHITPPLTPNDPTRPLFHNFLRAFYEFHPDEIVSSGTVTLPLSAGDVVLVHSIHTNGWADGTLLSSGARGWLPTNYCEPYDHEPIQNLLQALIQFWDVVRGAQETNFTGFGNHECVRGIIAGVRLLLEKCDCLTREYSLIRSHDGLRRNRKVLLSELSSLVKIAKRLESLATGAHTPENIDDIFEEVVLKAFKLVTRAVKFLDIWNEDVAGVDAREEVLEVNEWPQGDSVPPTPPPDATRFQPSTAPPNPNVQDDVSQSIIPPAVPLGDQHVVQSSGNDRQQTKNFPFTASNSQTPKAPFSNRPLLSDTPSTKRGSASHRISYAPKLSQSINPNFALHKLCTAHDIFLSHLGSLIGLHIQSRFTSEVILTTQQAVDSGRNLVVIIEAIWDRDMQRSDVLAQANRVMFNKINGLAKAAKDVFRPSSSGSVEDGVIMDEEQKMVMAATECVRAGGDCVAKARYVIERIGDFEFEPVGLGISSAFTGLSISSQTICPDNAHKPTWPPEPAVAPPPPPRESSLPGDSQPRRESVDMTPRPETHSARSTTDRSSGRSLLPPLPTFPSPLMPSDEYTSKAPTTPEQEPNSEYEGNSRSQRFTVGSTGTSSTYMTSVRGSSNSMESDASTRATTPEPSSIHRQDFVCENRLSGSQTTLAEDTEDAEAQILQKTYAHQLIFNKDGQIAGGTLPALVERLSTHDTTPDSMFVSTFYLTFRLFTTPGAFAKALVDRFDYVADSPQIAGPVRLRVYNVFKGWLESHWRGESDQDALPTITTFASEQLKTFLPAAGKRLLELADKVSSVEGPLVPRLISSIGKTNTASAHYVAHDAPMPTPIISKSQIHALQNQKTGGRVVSILDLDPLELARQVTLKESKIFCSILPEELLSQAWSKKSGSLAARVRSMSALSTDLSNLVVDTVLNPEEPKKRALIVKHWVKVANKCLELNNYESLMAIVCSLNTSTIQRLKKTWDLVSQKTKAVLDELRDVVSVSNNHAVLRQRLQGHVPPCLPFVGMYLTDLTFVEVGNPATRQLPAEGGKEGMAVINFDKHMKTAKIISDLQRFQIPYRLIEVPEMQEWMENQVKRVRSSGLADIHNSYRRSLLLEPREPTPIPQFKPSPKETQDLAAFQAQAQSRDGTKDKFDFWGLGGSKDKSGVPTHT